MYSVIASAICLLLIQQSAAHIPHSPQQIANREADPDQSSNAISWFSYLLKRSDSSERRQNICYEDDFYAFVSNATSGQAFCQAFMDYPDATVTMDYAMTSTLKTIVTTVLVTNTDLVRVTPTYTVTVTQAPQLAKRAPESIVVDYFAQYEAQAADNGSPIDDTALSASFSSACACQTYGGSTITETLTDNRVIKTLAGFLKSTTTITTTRDVNAVFTTVTVTAASSTGSSAGPSTTQATVRAPSVLPASSTSNDPSAPTGLAFSCPSANGTTVSQLVGSERFDYLIMCDYDYPKEDTFYAELAYNSFAECAGACSMADAYFDNTFCQVAVYYPTADSNGYNCLLKPSTTTGIRAPGVNAAVLQIVAVGVNDSSPDGTASEIVAAFAPKTSSLPTSAASSSISSLMGNGSSTSIPIITPAPILPVGRAAQAEAFTIYSTYVSDGSTYSTGSAFSTYFSGNGSWYYVYYNTYSVAWASATTIVGINSNNNEVSQTNSSSEYRENHSDGSYETITNTTVVTYTYYPNETVANSTDSIVYSSFDSNGNFVTASTTVVYGVETYRVGGTTFSTGGYITPATTTNTPVIVSASSTVYVSTYSTSGSGGSAGGNGVSIIVASGGAGGGAYFSTAGIASPSSTQSIVSSTAAASTPQVSTISVIVSSYSTNGGTFAQGSGVIAQSTPTTTLQESSGFGGTASTPQVSTISVIVSSYSTNGGTFAQGSGVIAQSTPTTTSQESSGSGGTAPPPSSTDEGSYSAPGDLRTHNPFPSSTITTIGLLSASSASPISISSAVLPSSSTSFVPPFPPTVYYGQVPSPSQVSLPSSSGSTPVSPVGTGLSSLFTTTPPSSSGGGQSSSSTGSDTDTTDTGTNGLRTGSQPLPSTPSISASSSVGVASSSSTSSSIPIMPTYSYAVYVVPVSSPLTTSSSSTFSDEEDCCFTVISGQRVRISHTPTSGSATGSLPVPSGNLSSALILTGSGTNSFSSPSGSVSGSSSVSTALSDSFSISGQPRSGMASPPASGATGISPPTPSGSAPVSTAPSDSFSISGQPRSGMASPPASGATGTSPSTPSGSAPVSTVLSDSFSISGQPRSGVSSPPTSGATGISSTTPSPPLNTSPLTTSVPAFQGYNCTQGTTTVFTTVTLYGCYSHCLPSQGYTAGLAAFGQGPPN